MMNPKLFSYIAEVLESLDTIPAGRKRLLDKMAYFVKTKKDGGKAANLVFICTHNSRRSQFAQVWAATAARYFDMAENVHAYSGGTEITAFDWRAVDVLSRAGFIIKNPAGANPRYQIAFANGDAALECHSKKYDDWPNPCENFAAIMTCSHADEKCPFIPGADWRVSIPCDDPKEADGTPQEMAVYDQRCRQVATEIFYVFRFDHDWEYDARYVTSHENCFCLN